MLISFVMPVFKKEEYLRDAIDSVLNQTHKDIELIIVDDATPKSHGIKEIVQYFMSQDKRVRYYRNKKNLGVANTRNIANSKAKGKIICIQDADDLSYPKRAEIVLNYFKKHKDVDLMYGSCEIVTDMGKSIVKREAEEFNIGRMKSANYINHLTVSYRRNIGVRYRKNYRYIDDWFFYMDCFVAGKKFGWVSDVLAVYRLVGDGLTYGDDYSKKYKNNLRHALHCEFKNLEVDISNQISKSQLQKIRINRISALVPAKSKVLELGCNTGTVMKYLKKKNCSVRGVEIALNLVNAGRKKGLSIVQADITKYCNGSRYDRIILGDVLEHYLIGDVKKILDNAVKMLRYKGKLVITVPYEHGLYSKQYIPEHIMDYSAEDIQSLLPNMKVDSQPIICGTIAIPAWLIMTAQ